MGYDARRPPPDRKENMARGNSESDVWRKILGPKYDEYRVEAEAIRSSGHYTLDDPFHPADHPSREFDREVGR
jgi:hypothetical protein